MVLLNVVSDWQQQKTGTLRKVYASNEEGPSELVLHNWKMLKSRRDLTDLRFGLL